MTHRKSYLFNQRKAFSPQVPAILQQLTGISLEKGEATQSIADREKIQSLFPRTYGAPIVTAKKGGKRGGKALRVGVVFSGGQASGGHNVISGLFDALQSLDKNSHLIGFLGGPSGIVDSKTEEITAERLADYRNQGGFDLIGSGRTKIETDEQLAKSAETCQALSLDGLVIIGGDDSNTNAALLAEYFLDHNISTKVIGVPKTIDGDLKNEYIPVSFGFDTACRTYSEMIGNIQRDALSAKKYYHFVKLMGRSAAHIALECALQTHANVTLLGEEVEAKQMTLQQVTDQIADVIVKRAEAGKNYGVVLIPEGLIEFIPEFKTLISELNRLLANGNLSKEQIEQQLSAEAKGCFAALPERIQEQLLLDRDPHGNVQVSHIETEKLFIETVKQELSKRNKGEKFNPIAHFFGYEGRAGFPSNFDTAYCYALGMTAALLAEEGLTGYMARVFDLEKPVSDWQVGGIPTTMLFNIEERKGKEKPVIQKALVELNGKPFALFSSIRDKWAFEDHYRIPGPIQFGDLPIEETLPITLLIEREKISSI